VMIYGVHSLWLSYLRKWRQLQYDLPFILPGSPRHTHIHALTSQNTYCTAECPNELSTQSGENSTARCRTSLDSGPKQPFRRLKASNTGLLEHFHWWIEGPHIYSSTRKFDNSIYTLWSWWSLCPVTSDCQMVQYPWLINHSEHELIS
jgi:hypothetical protein